MRSRLLPLTLLQLAMLGVSGMVAAGSAREPQRQSQPEAARFRV